jgi:hypothetical protein
MHGMDIVSLSIGLLVEVQGMADSGLRRRRSRFMTMARERSFR